MEKAMLRKWLKAGYMEKQVLHPTEEGTPQGGIVSPVLANMALDGLEKRLQETFPKPKTGYNAKVNFVRYADDFLVTGASKELLEKEVKPLVEHFMSERGLELSPEKTVITHIEEGFDFLGQNVRKYKAGKQSKLLVKPSKKAVQAHLEKLRGIVKKNKAIPAGELIRRLNPIIRGWAQYHQHVVSKDTFNAVDCAIYQLVRRWAKRRHPTKSNEWVRKKYFTTVEGNNWVFYAEVDGQKITKITGWQSHHILWRSKGGSDAAENRMLLHPNCHQQIHSQGLAVEKPRPAKGVRKA